MDWLTLGWLTPLVASIALTLVARARRDWALVATGIACIVVWGIAIGVADLACRWEGFTDGPLPIECRTDRPN